MFNVIRGLPRGGKVMSSIFEQIKFKVTARQVAESYGIKVSRNGMACCPFHNDKHPSMKIDQNYYCFACGAKGDAINFVASMFGLTQFEAAKKINEDFSLRIPIGKSSERKGQSKRKNDCNKTQTKEERIRFVRRKIAEWKKETIYVLHRYQQWMDFWKRFYCPELMESEWNPLFVEALQKESRIQYLLDILKSRKEEDVLDFSKMEGRR